MKRLSRKQKCYIAIAVIVALWSVVGGYVLSASLIQAADNSNVSTNTSWNRAFLCSQTTEFCYAWGGGTILGSDVDNTYRYDPVADSWNDAAIPELPPTNEWLFGNYAIGACNDLLIATEGDLEQSYLYNETTTTFQTISPPVGAPFGFGFTGVSTGCEYSLFTFTSNILTKYTLDMENPGDGWNSQQDALVAANSVQLSKAIYDPTNEVIVIIARDNGATWIWDLATAQVTVATNAFPPCSGAGVGCYASFFTWDANLGLVAGQQGTPSSTTIGLYQFDVEANEWGSTTVETLSEADFNYLAFTSFAPLNASYTLNGVTTTMFGGGVTNLANPGVAASEWFIRTGDPGGVTTTDRNIDTWLTNFLASMGMDSAFGRLLIGSLFGVIIFAFLTVFKVHWIISLGATGMAVTFLTAATIFNEVVLLGLVALVMLGGMGLIFALLMGGRDSSG